jgi:hypothetical protein
MSVSARSFVSAPAARPSTGVEVRRVRGRRELNAFIKLPFELYRGEPNLVPPLIMERRRHLDGKKNPFFEHAEAEAALLASAEGWLRERGRGRMVGPMDFTTNHECGLLVEGHELKPREEASFL